MNKHFLLILIAAGLISCKKDAAPYLTSDAAASEINKSKKERSILFINNQTGIYQLYAMNPDGSNVVQLTNLEGPVGRGSWSANGQHIAFAAGTAGDQDIYVMNANGSGLRNITNTPGYDEDWPEWSVIGNALIFSSRWDFTTSTALSNHEIFTYDMDSHSFTRLTFRSQDDKWPTYSPDGSMIAFQSLVGAGNTDVFVMNADGSNVTQLTTSTALDQMPTWSPDGSQIAFMSTRSITDGSGTRNWPRVFVMDADGNNQHELLTIRSARPSWSRQENNIVFTSSSTFPGNPASFEIYRMNGDGTNQVMLTNNLSSEDFPFIK